MEKNKFKCRTCLTIFEKNYPFIPLTTLSESFSKFSIAHLIKDLASVQISTSDKRFPQNICQSCFLRLKQAYDFKTQIVNSDIILNNEIKNEQTIENFDDIKQSNKEAEKKLIEEKKVNIVVNKDTNDQIILKRKLLIVKNNNFKLDIKKRKLIAVNSCKEEQNNFNVEALEVIVSNAKVTNEKELIKKNSFLSINKVCDQDKIEPEKNKGNPKINEQIEIKETFDVDKIVKTDSETIGKSCVKNPENEQKVANNKNTISDNENNEINEIVVVCDSDNDLQQFNPPKSIQNESLSDKKHEKIKLKTWHKIKDFENATDAQLFIENENLWRKVGRGKNARGEKVYYNCKYKKMDDNKCPSAVYLYYPSLYRQVSLYSTLENHTHYNKLTDRGKKVVNELFENGVQDENQIFTALESRQILKPSINELNIYLDSLKNSKLKTLKNEHNNQCPGNFENDRNPLDLTIEKVLSNSKKKINQNKSKIKVDNSKSINYPIKRLKPRKKWYRLKEFQNSAEAKSHVKNEGVWTKRVRPTKNSFGERHVYNCTYDKECPALIFLFYHSTDDTVSLYSTMQKHKHVCRLNNQTKGIVTRLYQKNGVKDANEILDVLLKKHKLKPIPNFKRKLKSFLEILKQNEMNENNNCNERVSTKTEDDMIIKMEPLKMIEGKSNINEKTQETKICTKFIHCYVCGEKLQRFENKRHILKYHQPLKCCDYFFENYAFLSNHRLVHHAYYEENLRKIFWCQICDIEFETKEQILQHILEHKEEHHAVEVKIEDIKKELYSNDEQSYSSLESINKISQKDPLDLTTENDLINSQKQIDKNESTNKSQANENSLMHSYSDDIKYLKKSNIKYIESKLKDPGSNEGEHLCMFCQLKFKSKYGLEKHRMCIHPIKRILTNLKSEAIESEKNIKFDEIYTVDIVRENVTEMDEWNPRNKILYQILSTANENKALQGQFQCKVCNKKLKNLKELNYHKHFIKTKSKSKRKFKYPICPICKQCLAFSSYSSHIANHFGVKIYECPYSDCDKKFSTKESYTIHNTTHTKARNFLCTLCEKRFKSRQNFKTHLLSHDKSTKSNMILCERCPKIFYTKKGLNDHFILNHTDTKYICNICSRDFSNTNHLSRHLKNVHNFGNFDVECNICRKKFACDSHVEAHKTLSKKCNELWLALQNKIKIEKS